MRPASLSARGRRAHLYWYLVGVSVAATVSLAGLGYVYWFKPGKMLKAAALRPPTCVELLDRDGAVLDYICPFNGMRIWQPLSAMSGNVKSLVVMLEDDKFYGHAGLDFEQILNALEEDLEKKKLARGASTITQQLAKNLFLSKEKTLFRKASEVPLAMRLENELTKDQILELYLNTIEWGPGVYGLEAAARLYFDREASSLKDEQAWLLALMIPNPKELNLWLAPKAKKSILSRARRLATRLHQEHRMSRAQANEAYARFEGFLDEWSANKPSSYRRARRFPARWGALVGFNLGQVRAIEKTALAAGSRRGRGGSFRSQLDRMAQEKLESTMFENARGKAAFVVALVDADRKARAIIPHPNAAPTDEMNSIAAELGLKAEAFLASSLRADLFDF